MLSCVAPIGRAGDAGLPLLAGGPPGEAATGSVKKESGSPRPRTAFLARPEQGALNSPDMAAGGG